MVTKRWSNLFFQLVLILFISRSVTSDNFNWNQLADHVLTQRCQAGGCQKSQNSAASRSYGTQRHRSPVYRKPSARISNIQNYWNSESSSSESSQSSGIRDQISLLNNFTVPKLETQYFSSSLIKDSYIANQNDFTESPYYEKEVKYYTPNGSDYYSASGYEVVQSSGQKLSKKEDYDPYYGTIVSFDGSILNIHISCNRVVNIFKRFCFD